MALRDHSLDDKITAAALQEFSEKGYMEASLRKIAEKAGATVGAIQTRYKSKDDLFKSLLKPLLNDIEATFQEIKNDYYSCTDANFSLDLKASIQNESSAILRLIFAHYEEAVLLFCRSAGSSLEYYFDGIIKNKIEESISFFHNMGYNGIDEKLLRLLISVQFDSYRRIIMECPEWESAEMCMNALMTYHLGGWNALLNSINKIQEDVR